MNSKNKKNPKTGIILTLFILGIFMGAIDTGIVSPARVIIQNSLGVDEKIGIWMITIYTLTYASVIPISGKLADKLGRKYVYIVSIALFGIGSLICGLSTYCNSFYVLLFGRVIQAIGGGGIMPIATAEFGTTFPQEKRGVALGLVGATYGIANILGSSVGSAILDIFGKENWHWLFFINLPICIVIVVGGLIFMKNNKIEEIKKIDKLGTLILVCMIASLLYGLTNIDFFNFLISIKDIQVYPYLLATLVLMPIFVFVERKAEDPILNFEYFLNPRIAIVLLLSVMVGIGMMGMVFVPQYAENALKIKAGSGGYFVAILGLSSGIAAPISGKLIDKYGAKKILSIGFLISMIGAMYLILVAIKSNSLESVCISLVLMGLGMGFTMGAPLNYMMLENTKEEKANSALATLSLLRSIGTSISPAIMIGFIAHAGLSVQDNVMNILPEVKSPKIAQVVELQSMLDDLKSDPDMSKQLANFSIPDLNTQTNMKIDTSSGDLPKDILDEVQDSDATTITDITKEISAYMFKENVPPVVDKIEANVQQGIDGTQKGIDGITKGENELKKGINGIQIGINNMEKALSQMNKASTGIKKGISGINEGIVGMQAGIAKQVKAIAEIQAVYDKLPPIDTTEKNQMKIQLDSLIASRNQLNTKLQQSISEKKQMESNLANIVSQQNKLSSELSKSNTQKQEMLNALGTMEKQKESLVAVLDKTKEVKVAVPKAFEQSKVDYLNTIESMRGKIEKVFQDTLNIGFKQMYICVFVINLLAFTVLLFYKAPEGIDDRSYLKLKHKKKVFQYLKKNK